MTSALPARPDAADRAHLIVQLRTVLPADAVIDDPAVLAVHGTDAASADPSLSDGTITSRFADAEGELAAVLVRPRNTADVSAVLRLASDTGTPVVPQGARSGLVGGATAIPGGILLDMTGMNRIRMIDPANRVAIVEPGVIVADLQRAVAAEGFFYAPDPASAELASIGGTIATNAGGMRCIKYGVTRDWVRSLEVVLADGEVIRTRAQTVKAVAGLDLTGLIVGSEGTLGVVTEATLSLLPEPGPVRGIAASFPRATEAFTAAALLAAGPALPSTLEYLDDVSLRGIRQLHPDLPIPDDAAAWLLVVTDDRDPDIAAQQLDTFTAIVRDHGALSVDRADDPASLTSLFTARRALSPALRLVRGGTTHGDLAVPRSALPLVAEQAQQLQERLGVEISLAGHVGDGNLHPTVLYDPSNPEESRAAREAERELLSLAAQLNGTITGEHGVGTAKLDALADELSPRVRELQHSIKSVFDPRRILNPGRKL